MRGEDFAVDLCGIIDVLKPVVTMMIKAQTVNLPPWKIIAWFSRLQKILDTCQQELNNVSKGDKPSKSILPKLAEHWQEINDGREDEEEDLHQPGTFQVFSPSLSIMVLICTHYFYIFNHI